MPLFHNLRRREPNTTGRFRRTQRPGVVLSKGESHRGWTYQLVRHTTGTTVRRTVYNVTITEPSGVRLPYLTGFPSPARAADAAHKWIEKQSGNRDFADAPTPNPSPEDGGGGFRNSTL